MADRRESFNLSRLQTIITSLVGIGTIIGGLWFTLDYFYVSRTELTAFAIQDQENNQVTLDKLADLEEGVLSLTRIFLKSEIKTLGRQIEAVESINPKTPVEEQYLRDLKDAQKDLEESLSEL